MRLIFTILTVLCLWSTSLVAQQQPAPSSSNERLVKLYPNPAVSYITIDLQQNTKAGLQLQVYNGILGKKVYEVKITSYKFTINLNDYSRGIYVYHLVDQTGAIIEAGKFQVSK